jgi:hypothetical protein
VQILDFFESSLLRDQIGIAVQALRYDAEQLRMYSGDIGSFFGMTKQAIHNGWVRFQEVPHANGSPRTLPSKTYDYMPQTIQAQFDQRSPVSVRQLLDDIQLDFGISMPADTLRHIYRTLPEVKMVTRIPMDRSRVQYDQAKVSEFYDGLDAVPERIPSAFVFSADKSGCSEWSDRSEETKVQKIVDGFDPISRG